MLREKTSKRKMARDLFVFDQWIQAMAHEKTSFFFGVVVKTFSTVDCSIKTTSNLAKDHLKTKK